MARMINHHNGTAFVGSLVQASRQQFNNFVVMSKGACIYLDSCLMSGKLMRRLAEFDEGMTLCKLLEKL
jgi:hypothetical protein